MKREDCFSMLFFDDKMDGEFPRDREPKRTKRVCATRVRAAKQGRKNEFEIVCGWLECNCTYATGIYGQSV